MSNDTGKSFMPLLASLGTFFVLSFLNYLDLFSFISEVETKNLGYGVSFILALMVFLITGSKTVAYSLADEQSGELIKSRDFFLKLFDESPVPYVMADKDAVIVLPNKAAQRLFGRTSEDLTKYKFHEFNDPIYSDDSQHMHDRFIRGVPTTDIELEVIKEDGSKRWVRMSALPFHGTGGKRRSGGVVSFFDITEQKAVDKAKTEFVSLASHQLRTPLSAMKWYGEMALSEKAGELTEKQRRYIEKIYAGNERLIELVNLLLSASRLELGTLTIDIEKVNPVAMSKEIFEELTVLIQEKELHIVEQYSGDAENFHTDKKLLRMILQNLLSNAAKYTREQGEVRILLEIDRDRMHVKVEDNGLGIPLEQQDKIFTKMFRADNARLAVTDGTGLGLYIVKEAVEALGGEIEFTSTPNEGTMFMVVVPNGSTHGTITNTE